MLELKAVVVCDRCSKPSTEYKRGDGRPIDPDLVRKTLANDGWGRAGAGRLDLCPECTLEVARRDARRAGFTLVELLVVILIVGMLSALALPVILPAFRDRAVSSGAAIVQAAVVQARDRAARGGAAGIRLIPDDRAWPLVRQADGSIDPAAPIAYSRIETLVRPPSYHEGLVCVHRDGFPPGFTPDPGRLVLEESPVDQAGLRAAPTSWCWNVRIGEAVQFLGRWYTVTGPAFTPPGPLNSEGFVNVGPPGSTSPLDRGAGPVEWLYLTDRHDDDGDGWIDEGWDGFDNDLDGSSDEDDEWEAEAFRGLPADDVDALGNPIATVRPYTLERRPIADPRDAVELPSAVVIDGTGWTAAGLAVAADGSTFDRRLRSQIPVNRYTGAVDLTLASDGSVDFPTFYGRPAWTPIGASWVHLWIAGREDVRGTTPAADGLPTIAPFPAAAALVSVDRFAGRVESGEADAADPAAAFARTEGRGR